MSRATFWAAPTGSGVATTIETTSSHPFWAANVGRWVDAGDLTAGTVLLAADGSRVTVAVVRTFAGSKWMRDLTVNNIHTYYVVAGDTPVLVHNCTISPHQLNRTEELHGAVSETKVNEIAESMRENGWSGGPIKVYEQNGHNYVIDGHHRVAAAKIAGIDVHYTTMTFDEVVAGGYRYGSPNEIISAAVEIGRDTINRSRRRR